MKKIYKINGKIDYQKAYYSALKKVFSVTLFPRILINVKYDNFLKKIKKYAYFECFFTQNSRFFAKNVHNKCFDIGLFFFNKNKNTYLKIYDGTGHIAGSFVTNFFDNIFAMNYNDFKKEKNNIEKKYNNLDKNKLLNQKV